MSHAHNNGIAKSRLGPPRFGRCGDSAGAGPVVEYRLSEEERLALVEKYGPPMPPEKAERVRMKYRRLCGGPPVGREQQNEEGGGDGDMPPKLDITKEQIESALRVTKGNAKKAIAILKIGVGTFYKYVREFGIDVASFKAPEMDAEEADAGETQDAGAEEAAGPETETRTADQAAPETWETQWETQYEPEEEPMPEPPAPESAAQETALSLPADGEDTGKEDIFSTWTRVEQKNFTGRKENMISVDKRGTIRLLSSIGSTFQAGDRVEFFLSPDKTRLAVRKADGIGGFKLRPDDKSKAKMCTCAELKNLLLEAGVGLPARFAAEWDERLQAWIGEAVNHGS